jgi:hypothetical protein
MEEQILPYSIYNQHMGLHWKVLSLELTQEIDFPGSLDVGFTFPRSSMR